jgi:hypothetical protein
MTKSLNFFKIGQGMSELFETKKLFHFLSSFALLEFLTNLQKINKLASLNPGKRFNLCLIFVIQPETLPD